jgi:hypothetical protein
MSVVIAATLAHRVWSDKDHKSGLRFGQATVALDAFLDIAELDANH